MAGRLKLEAFDAPEPKQQLEQVELERNQFEDVKLAAFEQGYAAGWDDAVAAQDGEAARLRADLGRNLQDLAFTYHEARAHVLRALEPLLFDMTAKVLPAIARETLGQIVLEQLRPVAGSMASSPLGVVASPVALPQIQALLGDTSNLPFTFTEEPSLSEGQVYLRLGEAETRIDLDGVIAAIQKAVSAHFRIASEENPDG